MKQNMKENKSGKRIAFFIAMLVGYCLIALAVLYFVYNNGQYPYGSDTMCHVYKGKKLYEEILNGNYYPLLDLRWYNGVQMMRYWAPLPVYVMAGCVALGGGSEMTGYLIYVFMIAFFGAVVWLVMGYRMKRERLGAFLGALWFFMPNNLYALFYEGNLPRALSMVFLPWLLYRCHAYLKEKKVKHLVGIMLTFSLLTLCHLGYAGMILLSFMVFFLFYSFSGGGRKALHCFLSIIFGVTLVGFWVYPSLQGGISSMDSSEVMAGFFQSLFTTLNPFLRLQTQDTWFYFGLSAFLVILAGILAGKKGSRTYFATALVLLLLTSPWFYPILVRLPIGQYLWMLRFLSIALAMVLFGLLLWDSLKRWILICFAALLVLDTLPSLSLVYGFANSEPVEVRMERALKETLLDKAREITKNRLALIDASSLGATGAYLSSDYKQETDITFGAGWQSAATASNIMLLNQAAEGGAFLYLFDRALALGNDTLLIRNSVLPGTDEKTLSELAMAASAVGYEQVEANREYSLFHMETPDCFGVITSYSAIGIGKAAREFSLYYPAIRETQDDNINHYSLDELSQYKLLYLDGFTYTNKSEAEELLRNLADLGVRIVINGAGIPLDEHTGIQSFLGITCQPIFFKNGYPLLDTKWGTMDTTLFPQGHTNWRTVYLEGLDNSIGRLEELGLSLSFLGTAGGSDNIYAVGLGLPYYYGLTKDSSIRALLDFVMQTNTMSLPENQVVTLRVEQTKGKLTIISEQDGVNTTLAYHDIFASASPIRDENHLLVVDAGVTEIVMTYPYWKEGLLLSGLTVLMAVVAFVCVKLLWKRREVKSVAIYGIPKPRVGTTPREGWMVPKGASYGVAELVWKNEEGEVMTSDMVFEPGNYRVCLKLSALGESIFADSVEVTVNGLVPDKVCREGRSELYAELMYPVKKAFTFLLQPQEAQGYEDEKIRITWQISESGKASYLQILEQDKWIITDVLPCQGNELLSYSDQGDMIGENLYRIVVIDENGTANFSNEFKIHRRRGKRMRVLVTGVKGQLGYDVVKELEKRGQEAVGVDIEEMDITDAAQVEDVITKAKVQAVIHCAAYTAVDAAEENEDVCRRINAGGTENIARVCKKLDLKMMYISTDYVFDGEGERPWEPEDEAHPKSVYGQTKYEGELAVTGLLEKFFIVRIAWVFGIHGKNFVKTMLQVGKTHDTLTVVNDQFGSPTYTFDLAKLLVDMIATEKYGIYHATNEGVCSWYDFACAIFKEAGMDVTVKPVTSAEYGAKANRPSNSRMSKEKLSENGFSKLPSWQDALHRYLEELAKEA